MKKKGNCLRFLVVTLTSVLSLSEDEEVKLLIF